MSNVDGNTWTLAASGDIGSEVTWESGYVLIGCARSLLILLEWVEEKNIDWVYLLNGLTRLAVLEEIEFTPLYVHRYFEDIEGFLTIEEEPESELGPGCSFNHIDIYVGKDDIEILMEQFGILVNRLQSYPLLQPFL